MSAIGSRRGNGMSGLDLNYFCWKVIDFLKKIMEIVGEKDKYDYL